MFTKTFSKPKRNYKCSYITNKSKIIIYSPYYFKFEDQLPKRITYPLPLLQQPEKINKTYNVMFE